mgnify:CR=1 FL=1
MKLFISIVLLICSGLVGYHYANKLVKRRVFYEAMREFNKYFKSEVSFSKNSILTIINEKNSNEDFYKLLKNNLKITNNDVVVSYLKKDELSYIKNYAENLSNRDAKTLVKYLEQHDLTIEGYLLEAKENENKYKSLYVKLGVLFGLIIFILLL